MHDAFLEYQLYIYTTLKKKPQASFKKCSYKLHTGSAFFRNTVLL